MAGAGCAVMRVVALLSLTIAACSGQSPQATPSEQPAEPPQPSGPPAPDNMPDASASASPTSRWTMVANAQAAGLQLDDGEGGFRIAISCTRRPAMLFVDVPAFEPIGSEERLTLGLGEEAVTLVADPRRAPIQGAGAPPENLDSMLGAAATISSVYGAQREGPHPAPSDEQKKALADACRPAPDLR